MVYYHGGYRKRSRRSRSSWRAYSASKYQELFSLFGRGIYEIRNAFLNLNNEDLDELLTVYGKIHGESAEDYARKTFAAWKSGRTGLSGQTMERLVSLVPPYLTSDQRFQFLKLLVSHYKPVVQNISVRVNIKEPTEGFQKLEEALNSLKKEDLLASLPEKVMNAAKWLYDDDITALRAMLAEADRYENDSIRAKAHREIELLKRTIGTGQIKSASYSIELPAGKLNVIAYTPSNCFVATVCFGSESYETNFLRSWRDRSLLNKPWGVKFIVWYYKNGEVLSKIIGSSFFLTKVARFVLLMLIKIVSLRLKK